MDVRLRQSHNSDDLEQDRRLINKKLQLRRSRQTTTQQADEEEEDDPSVLDYYYNSNNNNNDIMDDFDTFYENNGGDGTDVEEYMLRQAHEHDEQLIGGKVVTEEGFEAMNQALTSPPVAWWAKRKQWQKRTQERLVGGLGMNISSRSGTGNNSSITGRENNYGGDESNRVDNNNGSGGGDDQETGNEQQRYMMSSEEGVLGHPVMLTDPTSMGYDTESFRQRQDGNGIYSTSSSSSNNKKKRKPAVLFVPRSTIKRRSAQQMAYIISALCVIFLFMFFLQQIKLSHYAMVESPLPLSAYLAGERYDESTNGANNQVTLGSLGLKEFEFDGKIQGIPVVEFGKIQVDREDPLAQQMMTETATDGSGMTVEEEEQQSAGIIHGADYFEILKGVITGWGITPPEILANEESPQYKALHWMAYEDILRRQPDTDFKIKKIIQRYVLSVIYFATAGELWRHSALFLSNLDECSWNVKIEPKFFLGAGGCEEGLITRLDLWGNHLTGALPPEVGSLNTLEFISVFDNNMRGPPPKSMVHLKNLKKLYLQKNDFQGDVDFLCVNKIKLFKTDCGKRGGVTCTCCSGCGYNANNDKPAQ